MGLACERCRRAGIRDVDGDVGEDQRVVSCGEMVCVIGIGNESSGVFEWFMVFEMGGIGIRTVALRGVVPIVGTGGKVLMCNKNCGGLYRMVALGRGDLTEITG